MWDNECEIEGGLRGWECEVAYSVREWWIDDNSSDDKNW